MLACLRSRQALRDVDPSRLDDLGLSAEAVRREVARPLWDVPHSWLR